MNRRHANPGTCVSRRARIAETAFGCDEHVLCDVLSGVHVANDTLGDANDSLIVSPKEQLERSLGADSPLGFGTHRSGFHPHRLPSTAGAANVTQHFYGTDTLT